MKTLSRIVMMSVLLWVSACMEPVSNDANPSKEVKIIDGRLAFPSDELFFAKLNELKRMNYGDAERWSNQFEFSNLSSLLSKSYDADGGLPANIQEYVDYSPAHQLVLNENGLVQVGDNVVLYKGGVKYIMNVDAYNALSNKNDIMKSTTKGYYTINKIEKEEGTNTGRYFDAWLDGTVGAGGDQYTYDLSDGSHRKFTSLFYVNTESMTQLFNCGDDYNAVIDIYLQLKLEGRTKNSKPWSPAPDLRELAWNLTISDLYIDVYRACTPEAATYPVTGGSKSGSISSTTTPFVSVLLVSTTQEVEFDVFSSGYFYRFHGSVTGTTRQHEFGAADHTVNF